MSHRHATDKTASPATASRGRVLSRLLARGWEFDFFQAVWLLQRMGSGLPVGHRGPRSQERVRFRPHVSLGFPPTDVREIAACPQEGCEEPLHRVEVTFLGLYGVSTPLPLHYAVDILRSVENIPLQATTAGAAPASTAPSPDAAPNAARDFLDLLHHRLISLFYRSWCKYRHYVTVDGSDRDALTEYMMWLIGCHPSWDASVLGVCPVRLIRYAGLLTQRPRSAAALECMLFDYFKGIPVAVWQAVGRWVSLKEADLNQMGVKNSRLGLDLTVGDQVYDLNGAFEVAFGPVDWATYLSFLPDGPRFAQARSLVRLHTTDPLSFQIRVTLRPGEVPEMLLCSNPRAGRLGYTSWVRTAPLPETSVVFDAAG